MWWEDFSDSHPYIAAILGFIVLLLIWATFPDPPEPEPHDFTINDTVDRDSRGRR
jgi:hypothetical protein